MRLSTAVALALTVLLAVSAIGSVVVPAAASSSADSESPALPSSHPSSDAFAAAVQGNTTNYEPEPADTWQEIRLNVTDDGDVRWTIESRFVLSDSETDQFEAYATDIANGDRETRGYDVEQYEQALEQAERSTGREMAYEDASWNEPRYESLETEESTDRKLGIISYSFTWTNFAVADGDRIHFGDAFVTDNGVWFPALADGQRFVVESPANYGFETAPAGIADGAVVRDGPTTLDADDFQMVFFRNGNGPGSSGSNGGFDGPLSFMSGALVVVAFGGFALLLVGTLLLISRYSRSEWPFNGTIDLAKRLQNSRTSPNEVSEPVERETNPNGGIEHEFDETETVTGVGMGAPDDDIDPELLSDEERVLRLLERNGGRMKQATIVSETGWSNAKVSQLLSKMDDDDDIEKLRIGRENLITLPGVDPTETN